MTTIQWKFCGQQKSVARLFSAYTKDKLNHAYLFLGPAHIGKTTLARILAGAYLCTEKPGPCSSCKSCTLIAAGNHPDLVVNDTEAPLKIEEIRELQSKLNLTPFMGHRKACLLIGANRMTIEAANSLLKTLEEPPANSLIILTAETLSGLPSTIISRCQTIRFTPVTKQELEEFITSEFGVNDPELFVTSQNKPGLALALLKEPELQEKYEQAEAEIEELFTATVNAGFKWSETLSKKNKEEISWYLDVMLLVIQKKVSKAAALSTSKTKALLNLAKTILGYKTYLYQNVNSRLLLDVLSLKMRTHD